MKLQSKRWLFLIAVLILGGILLARCDVQPIPTPTPVEVERVVAEQEVYVPLALHNSGLRKCVEVWTGISATEFEWLQELKPWCVKIHFNSDTGGDAWHSFLEHGWDELDTKLIPDLEKIRSIGAITIFTIHTNKSDLTCQALPQGQFKTFAEFVKNVVARYGLKHVDIGNEVDAEGGKPGRFGCHGRAFLFAKTWQAVRDELPTDVKMGVSFMTDTPDKKPFIGFVLNRIEPDFVGIHHYEYYAGNTILAGGIAAWDLAQKYAWVQEKTDSPVWITETNLLWPGGDCGLDFQASQAGLIERLAKGYGTVIVIYVMNSYPAWVCAALNPDSLAWEHWISYNTPNPPEISDAESGYP